MVRLSIGTNTQRKSITVEVTSTVKEALNEARVDVGGSAIHLNGTLIPAADLNETFADLGIDDESEASLIAVKKADSAM